MHVMDNKVIKIHDIMEPSMWPKTLISDNLGSEIALCMAEK